MKKINLLIAGVLFAGGMNLAVADTFNDNFAGFGLGAGIGLDYEQVKVKNHANNQSNMKKNKGRFLGKVIFDYTMPVYNNFYTQFGVSYDVTRNEIVKTNTHKVKVENHTSVYVAPGYVFDNDYFLYGKLGYNYAKLKANNNVNLNGVGLGLGFSYAFYPQMEIGVEGDYVFYKDKKSGNTMKTKLRSTNVAITYKYRF